MRYGSFFSFNKLDISVFENGLSVAMCVSEGNVALIKYTVLWLMLNQQRDMM